MEVTDVKIRKYEKGAMLGFVTVQLDNCLEIKGFKLFKGREGRKFDVGLPSEKDKGGAKDENGNDKYWPLIYIDMKTESGKTLLNSIKRSIISEYEGNSGSAGGNYSQPSDGGGGGANWPDENDGVPF